MDHLVLLAESFLHVLARRFEDVFGRSLILGSLHNFQQNPVVFSEKIFLDFYTRIVGSDQNFIFTSEDFAEVFDCVVQPVALSRFLHFLRIQIEQF